MDPVSANSDADVTTFEVQVYACQWCNSQPVSQCDKRVKLNYKCFHNILLTREGYTCRVKDAIKQL